MWDVTGRQLWTDVERNSLHSHGWRGCGEADRLLVMRRLLVLLLVAFSLGAAAPAVAAAAPPTQCATNPATPKQELRAEWIASVTNIDWPSKPGLPADQQKAELLRWYDEAVALGLNAVVVQVRPTADAFWPSPFEPW